MRKPFDPNSSSQIPVDPGLGAPNDRDRKQWELTQGLIERGVPPAQAQAMAARMVVREHGAQVAEERRASGESAREEAPIRQRIDDEVRGYPMPQRPAGEKEAEDEYIRRFKVPPDARQLADFQRQLAQEQQQQLESDLDASGYGRERVPGARGLDGRPAKRGTPFESVEDAEAYNTRAPDASGQSPTPRYTPSQRDLDMHARGYAPVFNEDGSVGYSIATPDETLPEFASGNTLPRQAPVRGAPGRWGDRPDLKGYDPQVVEGPLGPVQVYRPRRTEGGSVENPGGGDGAGDRIDSYRNRRMRSRLRAASGLSAADAAKITDLDELRELGDDKRERDKAARQDLVTQRAQMQQNPLLYLSNPNVDPWSKMVMADQLLRRGFTGPTPLGVEAMNAERGGQMAQAAITAFLTNNPGATDAQKEAIRMQRRAADPAAAGAEDMASGNHTSPAAMAEADRLAGEMDTTYLGFSYEDERRLAARLQQPPYNMTQANAEEAAYRAAEKRRWVSGGRRGAYSQPLNAPPSGATPPPGA